MGIYLLRGVGAGVTGNPVDVHSIAGNRVSIRVVAIGGFTVDTIQIQQSPDGGTTWINEGSALANNAEVLLNYPYDLIRAVSGGAMVGTATVIAEVSA